ncbi:MAG TPA: CBS domain-containing protein [Pirellulaceae bacterium]|nr:CBS domain-containing protein [Pirellulaceae bacterium]HMO92159.1 CBS domain-containing protein [Pirellulaceae bacterium]HMP68915.1 CBS domain-containing protein [Pirellulaceae bacterium]
MSKSRNCNEFGLTGVMYKVEPVKAYSQMSDVGLDLIEAAATAAPVIDDAGHCVGILTFTDIANYRRKFKSTDKLDFHDLDSVVEEDESGSHCVRFESFDRVSRHMTAPAITVLIDADVEAVRALFEQHPNIHHLVVVDQGNRPLGIIDSNRLNS